MKKERYCADTAIRGLRLVQVKGTENKFNVQEKPDAGTTAWPERNVADSGTRAEQQF
jgi:hypothetical protein